MKRLLVLGFLAAFSFPASAIIVSDVSVDPFGDIFVSTPPINVSVNEAFSFGTFDNFDTLDPGILSIGISDFGLSFVVDNSVPISLLTASFGLHSFAGYQFEIMGFGAPGVENSINAGGGALSGSVNFSSGPRSLIGRFLQVPVVDSPSTTVPEPSSLALLAFGIAGVAFARRKRGLSLERAS